MVTNTNICDTALSFVGKLEYKFGGDNITDGYGDCSDFTQYVYSCYGMDIGGNTDTQYHQGVSVDKDQIKAGDLIFFKNTYKSKYTDGVSHVGIALGNNKFVHLGNSGCKVSDLSERYYSNHYLGARRISGISYEYDTINPDTVIGSLDTEKAQGGYSDDAGLEWWGDIVRVVVIVILCITGVALVASSVGINIMKGGVLNGN